MKDLLTFDSMLTPKIITLLYWLGLIMTTLAGLGYMFTQSFILGLIMLVGGLIGTRIWCELLIVIFKINQNLQTLANKANTTGE
ncbi:DUF4282 domain-containing protein [Pseudomonas asuensis]|jgi:hypothetical protein|uniref:Membrane protein n=1 Tax=Pseudomonas asuensis TaxID=1825787 RepID=A0ABQ2GT65_9PSED|nr:DUF4282 domain-containing protein [Pseudomonas asuensis]GGM09428.1 membrane protein [Pseudomonas asuensis]